MVKKINKQLVAAYAILGLAAVGVVVMFMKRTDPDEKKNFEVNLTENEKSGYETKLEAYEMGNNKEPKFSSRQLGNAYDSVVADKERVLTKPISTKSITVRKTSSTSASRQARQIANNINTGDGKYEKIEGKVREHYGGKPEETEKQRRKREMEQSWGRIEKTSKGMATKGSYSGVVYGTQSVKNGSTATFRSTQDIVTADGKTIPRNTLISGRVSFNKNRVLVSIGTVRVGRGIIRVQMSVYGSDGINGIPVVVDEGAMAARREVGDETIDQVGSAIRGVGGGIGRAISGIVTGTAKAIKKDKEQEIMLIDNQAILLQLN